MSTNPTTTVPAFQYETRIYEDLEDVIRGGGKVIEEIFIPSLKIIANSDDYLFHAEKPRNVYSVCFGKPEVETPLKEIQLPLELFEKIASITKRKLEFGNKEMNLTADLKKFWG